MLSKFGIGIAAFVLTVGVGSSVAAESADGSVVEGRTQGAVRTETKPSLFTLSEVTYVFEKLALAEVAIDTLDQLQAIQSTGSGPSVR